MPPVPPPSSLLQNPSSGAPSSNPAASGQPATIQSALAAARDSRSPRPLSEYASGKMKVSAQVAAIQFAPNSTDIQPSDLAVLREVAAEQKKNGGTIRAVGYAQGSVSGERALAVGRALVQNGVKPARIFAGEMSANDPGYGQSRPESVAANRRVDIFIDY